MSLPIVIVLCVTALLITLIWASTKHQAPAEGEVAVPKYRKLPVEIDAIEYRATNIAAVLHFIDAGGSTTTVDLHAPADPDRGHIDIPTLEGTMRANVGDWIIRGVKGELYPCKPDIFATTYEPVDQPEGN